MKAQWIAVGAAALWVAAAVGYAVLVFTDPGSDPLVWMFKAFVVFAGGSGLFLVLVTDRSGGDWLRIVGAACIGVGVAISAIA